MRISGAVIELNKKYKTVVVFVKLHVVTDDKASAELIGRVQPLFPGIAVTLCAQRPDGRARYRGPEPIVQMLRRYPPWELPRRVWDVPDKPGQAPGALGRPTLGQLRKMREAEAAGSVEPEGDAAPTAEDADEK